MDERPIITGTVRVMTRMRPSQGGIHEAWIDVNPKFKATATSSEEGAAYNLAVRYFFGTSKRREFPTDHELLTVKQVRDGLWEVSYQPVK